jgi:DNA polymerase-3 subunit delta'
MSDQEPSGFGILPWQREIWERLQLAGLQRRIPHALLFSGPKGLGKHSLVRLFAQSLLCGSTSEQGLGCGQCRGCHLFLAGTHPDFRWLAPEPDSKSREIKIDAVRAVNNADHLTAGADGYKITVITPAEQLNMAAANSLLKTLEEPSSSGLMFLISSRPSGLPATIRSRCQSVCFRIPPEFEARGWLQQRIAADQIDLVMGLSGGAPLVALELVDSKVLAGRSEVFEQFLGVVKDRQDPVAIVEDWLKRDIDLLLNWMSGWLIDMLRLQTGEKPPALFNPDQQDPLTEWSRKLDPRILHRLLQETYAARGSATTNLNPQLMLEKLLIDWSNTVGDKRA